MSASNHTLKLDPARDYVVRMPANPLAVAGGLVIIGGRNVVLIGGHVSIPWQGESPISGSRRGLYLKNQTGVVHVEGILIDGPDLAEGVNVDQRKGAIVQLQNIRVEDVHARDQVEFRDTHPDVVQSWGGPAQLRIDRLTGSTDYQGFFLHPTQYDPGAKLRLADFRNVELIGRATARYLLWQATAFPVHLENVWMSPPRGRSPRLTQWPSPEAWSGVHLGTPPGGAFVPREAVGTGYRSPGYAAAG